MNTRLVHPSVHINLVRIALVLLFVGQASCSTPHRNRTTQQSTAHLTSNATNFDDLQVCSLNLPPITNLTQNLLAFYPLQQDATNHYQANSQATHNGQVISQTSPPDYQFGQNGLTLGGNSYVEIPAHNDFNSGITNQMTFSFTIQSNDYDKKQGILSRRIWSSHGFFNFHVQNKKLSFAFCGPNHTSTKKECSIAYSYPILENGLTYRVTWSKTWGQKKTSLYINGHQVPLQEPPESFHTNLGDSDPASNMPVFIGVTRNSGFNMEEHFTGTISNVMIWNRQLSDSELQSQCETSNSINNSSASITIQEFTT